MANELYLSKERVRQVRNIILEKLPEKLPVLQHFSDDLQQNYSLDLEQNILWIDEEKAHWINSYLNTSFTPEFITFLFGIYLDEKYKIIGSFEDVLLGKRSRKRHSWSRFYLVRNEIAAEVDFGSLVQETYIKMTLKKTTTYISDFAAYVQSFIKPFSSIDIISILPVAEQIIFQELMCYPVSDGQLVFPQNKKRSPKSIRMWPWNISG